MYLTSTVALTIGLPLSNAVMQAVLRRVLEGRLLGLGVEVGEVFRVGCFVFLFFFFFSFSFFLFSFLESWLWFWRFARFVFISFLCASVPYPLTSSPSSP